MQVTSELVMFHFMSTDNILVWICGITCNEKILFKVDGACYSRYRSITSKVKGEVAPVFNQLSATL